MGYTHYFGFTEKPNLNQRGRVEYELITLMSNLPETTDTAGGYFSKYKLNLAGGNGTGKPIINNKKIFFNGLTEGKKDLSHETFSIIYDKPKSDFCKTNRKPYDFMVCLTLISLKNNIPDFYFDSDGDYYDWIPAIEFYKKHIGEIRFDIENILNSDN